ncbi:histone-fold-containing protein [Lophiotrema nucula]|uniref:DNA polymerase epsilon subunit D n=1 Tax=Lophiotrema nucula TaxID=690887 RepID=A0A6A5ZLW8_9PLEO|nr:histone-fold-containing protein [Lophiotrema nucula]
MPARKSNASAVSPDDSAKKADKDDGLSVEDLNLPKSIVQRLAKGVLPPNTSIQKDALLAMSKSATVFVNFLTANAAEHAARSGKKTVNPKDVFDAMREMEYESFLPRLEAEVAKFTSIQADKRNSYRKKVREEKKALKAGEAGEGAEGAEEKPPEVNGHADRDEEHKSKRVRRSSVDNGEHAEGSEDDGDETQEIEQDDEEVEDDEVEEEPVEEGLTEDPLEAKDSNDEEEDDMADGDESD